MGTVPPGNPLLLPENWEVKVGGSRLPPRAEPAGGGGWPPCPRPLCSRLPASPAKKGPSEDKDDISKLVTGLMKTSICRQISYKTVEGNEVRAAPSPCAPLPGTAHGMVLTSCPPPGHPRVLPQHRLQPRGDAGGGDLSQIRVPIHPGDDGQQL